MAINCTVLFIEEIRRYQTKVIKQKLWKRPTFTHTVQVNTGIPVTGCCSSPCKSIKEWGQFGVRPCWDAHRASGSGSSEPSSNWELAPCADQGQGRGHSWSAAEQPCFWAPTCFQPCVTTTADCYCIANAERLPAVIVKIRSIINSSFY